MLKRQAYENEKERLILVLISPEKAVLETSIKFYYEIIRVEEQVDRSELRYNMHSRK